MTKPKLEIASNPEDEAAATPAPDLEATPSATKDELDADEAEFRKLRRDLPRVKGASAAGIVSVGVNKIPGGMNFSGHTKNFVQSSRWSIPKSGWKNSISPLTPTWWWPLPASVSPSRNTRST